MEKTIEFASFLRTQFLSLLELIKLSPVSKGPGRLHSKRKKLMKRLVRTMTTKLLKIVKKNYPRRKRTFDPVTSDSLVFSDS
jgi:hypothetical protein